MKKEPIIFIGIIVVLIVLLILIFNLNNFDDEIIKNPTENKLLGDMENSLLMENGEIMIEGIGSFEFYPNDITSIRDEIFQTEHISVFDILVYLDNEDKIDMKYEFSIPMNTYVIESIDGEGKGEGDWWYQVYYDGGWPEKNVFRMDHYPYKDKMYIKIKKIGKNEISEIYSVFTDEIKRTEDNNNEIIIPRVILRGPNTDLEFNDVKIVSHNLRDDVFKNGTVTAIDTILSLADSGLINYDLQWYESIGRARVVKSYWVERINSDKAHDRCGFVYEAGSVKFPGFSGNHIHLPSDTRVINSPEYVEYFWICI
ncbi:hypothetical protein GOV12_05060 [Candidatus Pacearchaeota archaeon]|nr:hypothetical protein [Candidatus Pacearchaeota archaeon]